MTATAAIRDAGSPRRATTGAVVRFESVERRFERCIAVRGVTVELAPGSIHAIVGENGAGKSTLLKLAAGLLAPTTGRVLVDGQTLEPATPAHAIARGVGMVHQHFMLCGALTALDNLILGSEPILSLGRLDRAGARRSAAALAERTGLSVPLDSIVDDLTVGERQRLEILRVLFRGARALLLDEPTAVLSPLEATELFATLRTLAAEGRTVVVVTHRLDEVIGHADRVLVLRRGEAVCEARRGDPAFGEEALTRAIMGGEAPQPFAPVPVADDAPLALSIRDLVVEDADGRRRVDRLSLDVRAGELVGVAGVEGNGQTELVRALAGLDPVASGVVTVGGKTLDPHTAPAARRTTIACVHEDRQRDGLVLDATVGDNLVLGDLAPGFDEQKAIVRRLARFAVEPNDPGRLASELSGGNQQKVVLARAVDRIAGASHGVRPGSAVLVCAQPTRGVDVGAAAAIHAALGQAAERGLGVVVLSADLGELRRIAHRIDVMHRGRVVATLPPTADDDTIGRAMLGLGREAPADATRGAASPAGEGQ